MVSEHPGHVQVFNGDCLVLANQTGRYLVVEISARISDMSVHPRDAGHLLLTVV